MPNATAENVTASDAKAAALSPRQLFNLTWTMRESGAYGVDVQLANRKMGTYIVQPGYAVVVRTGGTAPARFCEFTPIDEAKVAIFDIFDDHANRPPDYWDETNGAGGGGW
jgi:hypothetical protein